MSGLKHAVKRRVHLERSTPPSHARAGPMERKADFKKRAIQIAEKQKLLKILNRKARERNPDEFRFGMKSAKVVQGKYRKLTDIANTPAQKKAKSKGKGKMRKL